MLNSIEKIDKEFGRRYLYDYMKTIDDEEILTAAVEFDFQCLAYIKKEKRTKNLYKASLKKHWRAFKFFPLEFKDYNTCLEAVKSSGINIYEVPYKLRTFEMCIMAIVNYRHSDIEMAIKYMGLEKLIPIFKRIGLIKDDLFSIYTPKNNYIIKLEI